MAPGRDPVPVGARRRDTIIDLLAAPRTGENADHLCLVVEPIDLAALKASGRFDVVDGPATPLRRPRQRHVALRAAIPTATPSSCATTEPVTVRSCMDVGDVVDDFELPDETGTPRKLSDLLAERAGGAVLLPGGDDARVHEGELPLP